MEWGRVKSILIALFLILNVVLAANIVNQYIDLSLRDEFRADIDQIIAKKGITLECELPVENREARRLIYGDSSEAAMEMALRLAGEELIGVEFTGPESFTYTGVIPDPGSFAYTEANPHPGSFAYTGANPQEGLRFEYAGGKLQDRPGFESAGGKLDGGPGFEYAGSKPQDGPVFEFMSGSARGGFNHEDDEKLDAAARALFEQAGIDMSEFIVDDTLQDNSGGKIIKYLRKYEGELIFDSNIKVYFNPLGGVYSISVNCRGVLGFSDEAMMQMIPAYQVVLRNAFQEGQVIRAIDVGYLGQDGEQDSAFTESMEVAVWRIKLDDGNSRYFEGAYGNEIIYVM